MFCKKCLFVFLSGVFAMHTLSHIAIAFTSLLPMRIWGFMFTQYINYEIIVGSIAFTMLFLYLAKKERCVCK